jgi:hypothetical protein
MKDLTPDLFESNETDEQQFAREMQTLSGECLATVARIMRDDCALSARRAPTPVVAKIYLEQADAWERVAQANEAARWERSAKDLMAS